MIEITLLGTGSHIPDPNRAGASTLVRARRAAVPGGLRAWSATVRGGGRRV